MNGVCLGERDFEKQIQVEDVECLVINKSFCYCFLNLEGCSLALAAKLQKFVALIVASKNRKSKINTNAFVKFCKETSIQKINCMHKRVTLLKPFNSYFPQPCFPLFL